MSLCFYSTTFYSPKLFWLVIFIENATHLWIIAQCQYYQCFHDCTLQYTVMHLLAEHYWIIIGNMLHDAWLRVDGNLFLDWLEKPLWNRRRGWIWWRRGWRNPIYKRGLPRNIFIRGWVMLCDSFNREKLYNCFEILSSSMWSSCQPSKFIVSSDMLMPNKSCVKSRWMQTNDRNY